MKKLITVTLLLIAVIFTACSEEEAKKIFGVEASETWQGTWAVTSVTLNGESQDTYGGVWSLSESSWTLTTVFCSAIGSLSSSGNDLSLTVGQTSCPETLPAPEGRTMTGFADVNGDKMTLTLTHELDGVTYTLVMECDRQ